MNRPNSLGIILITLAIACNVPNPTAAPTAGETPAQIPTDSAPVADTATPTQEAPAGPATNLVCNELALFLDPALASGHQCETVPAEGSPDMAHFEINPQHTRLTFTGYLLADRFMTPHIDIYPVAEFQALAPDAITARVAALQPLLGGAAPGESALPLLPLFNAAEMFHSQYALRSFQNGTGIRYIAMYGQAFYPINNHDMFFSYQGLTADGQYWISMILPIAHGSLPADGNTPPGGDWDAFYAQAETYMEEKETELDGQSEESFQPSIVMLDAMIMSILITP